MLTQTTIAWMASFIGLSSIWLIVAWKLTPQLAVGVTFALSLLVPSWVEFEIAGNPFPVRIASTSFSLVAYCFHPKAIFPWKLGVLDLLMLSLLGIHCISDTWNSGWSWTTLPRAYCEWGIPYIAGKLTLTDVRQFGILVNCFGMVAITIASLAVFEGLTRIHPWEYVFGERPLDGISKDISRWGVLRAWAESNIRIS